jgi:hypothetical protein
MADIWGLWSFRRILLFAVLKMGGVYRNIVL